MRNAQTSSNNANSQIRIYPCAGKGCKRKGKTYLKILLVNKSGWFCTLCESDLKEIGLVDCRD